VTFCVLKNTNMENMRNSEVQFSLPVKKNRFLLLYPTLSTCWTSL
jgi:hypothetical protein